MNELRALFGDLEGIWKGWQPTGAAGILNRWGDGLLS